MNAEVARARDHTRTGVLLLTIGIAIGWIPYIQDLGGLLIFIGIIFLFIGRWGFSDRHHDLVVAGGVLLVIAIIGVVIVAFALATALIQAATQIGATAQSVGATLQASIQDTLIATVVFAFISGLGQLLMVWGLADPTSRLLLVTGFVLAITISAVLLAIELPLLANAIQSATAGATINTGPINALEGQIQVYGLLSVVPASVTGFAYYRIWRGIDRLPMPEAPRASGY